MPGTNTYIIGPYVSYKEKSAENIFPDFDCQPKLKPLKMVTAPVSRGRIFSVEVGAVTDSDNIPNIHCEHKHKHHLNITSLEFYPPGIIFQISSHFESRIFIILYVFDFLLLISIFECHFCTDTQIVEYMTVAQQKMNLMCKNLTEFWSQ